MGEVLEGARNAGLWSKHEPLATPINTDNEKDLEDEQQELLKD